MTYSEFVKIYPALDLFLELFKGLGPTLIAILAIVLNHRNSVKRDKENRRNSLYYTVQKEMMDKFLELSQLQWKCGAILIDLLSTQDAGRGEDIQEIYSPVLYNMQFKAQEINDYYHSMFKSFGIAIDCSRIVEDSNIYSNELISICEKYKDVWKRESCFKVINQQLDIMGEEVKAATGRVKVYTNECMSELARNMRLQLV